MDSGIWSEAAGYLALTSSQESINAVMPLLKEKKGWTDEMEKTCREIAMKELHSGFPRYSFKMVTAWATAREKHVNT